MSPRLLIALAFALALPLAPAASAQQPSASSPAQSAPPMQPLEPLKEVPFAALSSGVVSPLGQAALSIRGSEWKHAETANFIYHFFHSFIAAPVSVEAEHYYRVIAKDLAKETARWERKCHIFIFESPDDWRQFQARGGLDPWTGGLHARNELFIVRDPSLKWKGHTLGHEVTHLVVNRFYGDNVPLWLNEGYAEYAARIAYAAFYRARGYAAKPRFSAAGESDLLAVKDLTERVAYPADVKAVEVFYTESEALVRFLASTDKAKFLQFFDQLAHGGPFDTALRNAYSQRFPLAGNFEGEFKRYAASQTANRE